MACPFAAFLLWRRLKCSPTSTPHSRSLLQSSTLAPLTPVPRPYMSGRGVLLCPPCTESPFAAIGYYSCAGRMHYYLDQHYLALIATTGSCARPPSSVTPCFTLWVTVFAGYCESLLEEGLSRRCLCGSFLTCLDPYPGSSWSAYTRFFPQDLGLPPVRTRSALSFIPTATSVGACFRGCSHSLMFRPASLLATQVAPTAAPEGTGQP